MASLAGQAKGKSRRQLILAKRLKALDFNVPNSLEMSDEACAIVEAVFTDLVSTTEAYESLQGKVRRQIALRSLFSSLWPRLLRSLDLTHPPHHTTGGAASKRALQGPGPGVPPPQGEH